MLDILLMVLLEGGSISNRLLKVLAGGYCEYISEGPDEGLFHIDFCASCSEWNDIPDRLLRVLYGDILDRLLRAYSR